jgi:hypothetical protein
MGAAREEAQHQCGRPCNTLLTLSPVTPGPSYTHCRTPITTDTAHSWVRSPTLLHTS